MPWICRKCETHNDGPDRICEVCGCVSEDADAPIKERPTIAKFIFGLIGFGALVGILLSLVFGMMWRALSNSQDAKPVQSGLIQSTLTGQGASQVEVATIYLYSTKSTAIFFYRPRGSQGWNGIKCTSRTLLFVYSGDYEVKIVDLNGKILLPSQQVSITRSIFYQIHEQTGKVKVNNIK